MPTRRPRPRGGQHCLAIEQKYGKHTTMRFARVFFGKVKIRIKKYEICIFLPIDFSRKVNIIKSIGIAGARR